MLIIKDGSDIGLLELRRKITPWFSLNAHYDISCVIIDYNNPISNSFKEWSEIFFLPLFTVCLYRSQYDKLEQLNVNKWAKNKQNKRPST